MQEDGLRFIFLYKSSLKKTQFFNHPEGYVSPVNASDISQGFKYVYQYKDHLGNVRLSYTDSDNNGVIDASTEIVEESNYYPFGLKHKGYNTIKNIGIGNASAQKFGYNGKELEESLGIQWMDFDARNYDATLGRWMNLDPLAEEMRRHSPYNYAFNNPIFFIDPDGMKPQDVIINGDLANKAVEQLNAANKNLTITRDTDTGKLSVSGEAVTDTEKTLVNAITDSSVEVNVNATSSNFTKDGIGIVGGTFGGSKVKKGVTIASQDVNPNQMDIIDDVTKRGKGVGATHEVLEAYIGAKESPGASIAISGIPNDAYDNAHAKAKALDIRHNDKFRIDNDLVSNKDNVTIFTIISSGGRNKYLMNQTMRIKDYKKIIRKSKRTIKRLKK